MSDLPEAVPEFRRKSFIWGLILAWVPILAVYAPGLYQTFHSISAQKTTGLGAVAGGLTEGFVMFGLATFVGAQLAGIVLLIRSFPKRHPLKSIVSVVSITCSVLVLLMLGVGLWMMLTMRARQG